MRFAFLAIIIIILFFHDKCFCLVCCLAFCGRRASDQNNINWFFCFLPFSHPSILFFRYFLHFTPSFLRSTPWPPTRELRSSRPSLRPGRSHLVTSSQSTTTAMVVRRVSSSVLSQIALAVKFSKSNSRLANCTARGTLPSPV